MEDRPRYPSGARVPFPDAEPCFATRVGTAPSMHRRRFEILARGRRNAGASSAATGRANSRVAKRTGGEVGVPRGSRTPVAAVKGRCPGPLDDGDEFLAPAGGYPERRRRRFWWSQAGSNRRPLQCHCSALPAELWPRKGADSSPLPRAPQCTKPRSAVAAARRRRFAGWRVEAPRSGTRMEDFRPRVPSRPASSARG